MSDPTDIFSTPVEPEQIKDEQGTTNTDGSSLSSSNASSPEADALALLASIKNERGEQKYTDLPKALEGLRNAQEYIPQLKDTLAQREQELEQLREQLTKSSKVEDLVTKLTASQTDQNTTASGLDEQKAMALFEQLLNQKEATKLAESNREVVNTELVTRYGSVESAKNAFEAKAQELGINPAELKRLTESTPKMVLALFPNQGGSPSAAPPKSSVNTAAMMSQTKPDQGLTLPGKSLLSGATYKEQLEFMKQVQQDVYKKHGITN